MVQKINLICTLLRKWVHFVFTHLILDTGTLVEVEWRPISAGTHRGVGLPQTYEGRQEVEAITTNA